ncbi:hypothetical protein NSE_0595 [Neorickettsia sennetsu str. Miyayama]|uniref:Uncharacterized protein n=1 Tax=Ehrlichia sennetsu (strain ATCC VR-367 / Miyayama) TaxID=222891 RepID=Q2GDH1_EHRS3|nr:hypothetical protein NSE_0595 [Neorickettsia sennetsu str. Miyayama]
MFHSSGFAFTATLSCCRCRGSFLFRDEAQLFFRTILAELFGVAYLFIEALRCF